MLACATLALLLLIVAGYRSVSNLDEIRYSVTPLPLTIPDDPEAIERGRYLAQAVLGCSVCHGADMTGAVFLDVPGVARIVGTNLTPTASAASLDYDDEDWLRAIRHGVAPDGRPLWFMGGGPVGLIAPEDLAALVAYMKSLAPIEQELPRTKVRWLGALSVLTGELDLTHAQHVQHDAPHPPPRPPINTGARYGHYLADIGACTDCHRSNLGGGPYPGAPPWFPAVPNITSEVMPASWSFEQFELAMRSGRALDGHLMHPLMPWVTYTNMRDEDLEALWAYISGLPPATFASVPFDPYRLPEASAHD